MQLPLTCSASLWPFSFLLQSFQRKIALLKEFCQLPLPHFLGRHAISSRYGSSNFCSPNTPLVGCGTLLLSSLHLCGHLASWALLRPFPGSFPFLPFYTSYWCHLLCDIFPDLSPEKLSLPLPLLPWSLFLSLTISSWFRHVLAVHSLRNLTHVQHPQLPPHNEDHQIHSFVQQTFLE